MSSDDRRSAQDVPFIPVGSGMKNPGLYCMRCHGMNKPRVGGRMFGPLKKLFSCADCEKERAIAKGKQ